MLLRKQKFQMQKCEFNFSSFPSAWLYLYIIHATLIIFCSFFLQMGIVQNWNENNEKGNMF